MFPVNPYQGYAANQNCEFPLTNRHTGVKLAQRLISTKYNLRIQQHSVHSVYFNKQGSLMAIQEQARLKEIQF